MLYFKMFYGSNTLFRSVIKFDVRFISLIKKARNPIITQDEQLFTNKKEEVSNKAITSNRKIISFFDKYSDKSIERLNIDDERFGSVILNARSLKDEKNDLMVIEGLNMIRDAIRLNGQLTHIYFTQRELLKEIPFRTLCSTANIYYVTYKNMQKFSNLKTPPGIMAVFKRPDPTQFLVDPIINKKLPLTLILDNIRDPGNLGSIIRTAAGLNVHKILLSKGCVDLYNEKVLRSSMSSIFCTPIFHNLCWNEIRNSLHPEAVVYCADIANRHEETESFPYYDDNVMDFNLKKHYSLIIGGEIDGISEEATRLSEETYGYKLHIPIVNAVNSFNSSIAAAIIMSDFQRKFLQCK